MSSSKRTVSLEIPHHAAQVIRVTESKMRTADCSEPCRHQDSSHCSALHCFHILHICVNLSPWRIAQATHAEVPDEKITHFNPLSLQLMPIYGFFFFFCCDLTRHNLREGGFILASGLRVPFIMMGTGWWWKWQGTIATGA